MKATTAGWILLAICVFAYLNPLQLIEESLNQSSPQIDYPARENSAYKRSMEFVKKGIKKQTTFEAKPVKEANTTFAGRALYLKGSTGSNTVGKQSSMERTIATGSTLKLHADMGWGVDVELRYGKKEMGLDLGVEWMHMNSNWKQGPALRAFIAPSLGDFEQYTIVSSLASSSRIALNAFDVNVGKTYLQQRKVHLKFFFGCAGLTVRQHFHQTVYGGNVPLPTSSTSFSSMNSIGLSTALSLEYMLGSGISLVGKTKGGALMTYLHSQVANYSVQNPSQIDSSFTTRKHFISGFFSQILGMEWGSNFHKGRSKLNIGAGWDLMVFTSAWNIGSGNRLERDNLGLQGLCLDAAISF